MSPCPLHDEREMQGTVVAPVPDATAGNLLATAQFALGQQVAVGRVLADVDEVKAPPGTVPNATNTWEGTNPRPVRAPQTSRDIPWPEVGAELFGFRLCQELGRGAFARVFLGKQADLAGRPVVLKISDLEGDEPQTLAQLQHTHIVPIYSVHEDRSRRLRAVCMPYFGGATLAAVLEALKRDAWPSRSGRALVEALQRVGSPLPAAPSTPPALIHLSGLTYPRAAAWIVARLAEGLHHAHLRGILHRDVKPSNVLIGADGQPMLLDFNLSQNPQDSDSPVLGGTLAYMAPEILHALVQHDRALARRVDHRADIYALGMVLHEMVTGRHPIDLTVHFSSLRERMQALGEERSRSAPSLCPGGEISWGLESIALKCLDPDPSRRYAQAGELAEDLRRFLDDRPLKHAPELSRAERLRKWGRRHPGFTSAASVATAALLLLLGVTVALVSARRHLTTAQDGLAAARVQEKQRAFDAGTLRALCLVNTISDAQGHLAQGKKVCEDTLNLYHVLNRSDWQEDPDYQRLDAEERRRIAEDVRELLLLLASAQARTGAPGQERLDQALALLKRAAAINGPGPSRALAEDQALYLEQQGKKAEAQTARARAQGIPPTSARDHYLLATALARGGRYAEAVRELDIALQLNPRHYWSWTQRGICYQELGESALAAGDFGVCVGLWPEFAWGYFNRGCVLQQMGKRAEAVRDYGAAVERDPTFLAAYRNRGLVQLERKQYAEALADFDQALALNPSDGVLQAGRGVALEGLQRHREADAAFAEALPQTRNAAAVVRARVLCAYGFAVAARLPERADAAFAEVLRRDPNHPQALYGRAMRQVEQGQEKEALAGFAQAVAVLPEFADARRARAILLARAGRFDEASQDVNWCLEKDSTDGKTLYTAACVAARAAAQARQPLAAQLAERQALRFLEQAFARDYGHDKAANDPDLRSLRNHPTFRQLLVPTEEK